MLSLCKNTFLFIIQTKTLNLIGNQFVHFCLTTYMRETIKQNPINKTFFDDKIMKYQSK
nr:MAG TPA: hypothetical protein [Caudoviricetes sp.]